MGMRSVSVKDVTKVQWHIGEICNVGSQSSSKWAVLVVTLKRTIVGRFYTPVTNGGVTAEGRGVTGVKGRGAFTD